MLAVLAPDAESEVAGADCEYGSIVGFFYILSGLENAARMGSRSVFSPGT